mmetsp:Transcript_7716/g.13902  ORF Transcript_7716/g.13902 Transcript_7716/m.13902 type:complete len:272 (-) Transcript_7716:2-817(-)
MIFGYNQDETQQRCSDCCCYCCFYHGKERAPYRIDLTTMVPFCLAPLVWWWPQGELAWQHPMHPLGSILPLLEWLLSFPPYSFRWRMALLLLFHIRDCVIWFESKRHVFQWLWLLHHNVANGPWGPRHGGSSRWFHDVVCVVRIPPRDIGRQEDVLHPTRLLHAIARPRYRGPWNGHPQAHHDTNVWQDNVGSGTRSVPRPASRDAHPVQTPWQHTPLTPPRHAHSHPHHDDNHGLTSSHLNLTTKTECHERVPLFQTVAARGATLPVLRP